MIGNYPDDVPAGSLRAPWNQPEREPHYQCDSCHEEPRCQGSVEVGSPCENVQPEFDRAGNEIPPCEGRYREVQHDD